MNTMFIAIRGGAPQHIENSISRVLARYPRSQVWVFIVVPQSRFDAGSASLALPAPLRDKLVGNNAVQLTPLTVVLDLSASALVVGGITIHLPYLELAFYNWIVDNGRAIRWGKQLSDEAWNDFVRCYHKIRKMHYCNCKKICVNNTIDDRAHYLNKILSTLKKRISKSSLPPEVASLVCPQVTGEYAQKELTLLVEVEIRAAERQDVGLG